jgi:hypothetical protein
VRQAKNPQAEIQGDGNVKSKLIALQSLCAVGALVLTMAAPWKW